MTAPVPEENDEPIATAGMPERPAEHGSDLPEPADREGGGPAQEENAGTWLDEPSDGSGSE
jgi:hypothetical protein